MGTPLPAKLPLFQGQARVEQPRIVDAALQTRFVPKEPPAHVPMEIKFIMDKQLLSQVSISTITNGALIQQNQRLQLVIDLLSLQDMMILLELEPTNAFAADQNTTSNLMIFKQEN
jgi:hypothetical protein